MQFDAGKFQAISYQLTGAHELPDKKRAEIQESQQTVRDLEIDITNDVSFHMHVNKIVQCADEWLDEFWEPPE